MATRAGRSKFIVTSCKVCGFAFKVQTRFAGKIGRCPQPGCGSPYRVPVPDPAAVQTVRNPPELNRRQST
ncbi:MAG: hypothetical protein IID45_14570, partial [Planctomycetes bacterium]|nr:hypothetical protein [Planctomycetota bacterium]